MKTYVLTVSRYFPATHKRKGELTFFIQKIKKALGIYEFHRPENISDKIHTIRSNYELWAKRIKEVQEGKAILSIRYWSGKPYNSKQVEICQLDKDSGIGIQMIKLKIKDGEFSFNLKNIDGEYWIKNKCEVGNSWKNYVYPNIEEVAKNDGLSFEDFKEWFRKYDLSKPMAIIHFTSFRY